MTDSDDVQDYFNAMGGVAGFVVASLTTACAAWVQMYPLLFLDVAVQCAISSRAARLLQRKDIVIAGE